MRRETLIANKNFEPNGKFAKGHKVFGGFKKKHKINNGRKQSKNHVKKRAQKITREKHYRWDGGKSTFLCSNCGKEFEAYKNRIKNKKTKFHFCSFECFKKFNHGKNHPCSGKIISQEHKDLLSKIHKGKISPNRGKKLSEETRKKISQSLRKNALRGEKSPAWKGGVTPEHKLIRDSFEYKKWRKFVFKRDDYTCQICGYRGGNLRANHIKKFVDYPKLRFSKNNGITICEKCDFRWILNRELEWESYFNFNLKTRGIIYA